MTGKRLTLSIASAVALALAGCKKSTPGAPPSPAPPPVSTAVVSPTETTPAPASIPNPVAVVPPAPPEDLTPPDTKLVTYDIKVDDFQLTIDAPAGCKVESSGSDASVYLKDGFGMLIEIGREKFDYDTDWWRARRGMYEPKRILTDTPDAFLVESTQTGDQRWAAAAKVAQPYLLFSMETEKNGGMGADVQTKSDCLLALRCAKTLKLKSPPPTDPAAVLEWLHAESHKGDDGAITSIELETYTTDAAMPLLASFPKLASLQVQGNVTADGLIELPKLPALTELSYDGYDIPAPAVAAISRIANLRSLHLGARMGSDHLGDSSLASLSALNHLDNLDLSGLFMGDDTLASIKAMTGLKSLAIGDRKPGDKREKPDRLKVCTVSDAGLASLAGMTQLESLSAIRIDATGSGFASLGGLTNLKTLCLANAFVNDDGLQAIGKLTSLESLDLSMTPVTGNGLKHLAGLKNLKKLYLNKTDVTDAGLGALTALPNLEELELTDTAVDDAGMKAFEGMTKLKSLDLSRTKITDAGLSHLYGLKELETYKLSTDGTGVTDAGTKKLEDAKSK